MRLVARGTCSVTCGVRFGSGFGVKLKTRLDLEIGWGKNVGVRIRVRQTRTSTVVFRRVDGEPGVAFLAHGRAVLGTEGAAHCHTVVAFAFIG